MADSAFRRLISAVVETDGRGACVSKMFHNVFLPIASGDGGRTFGRWLALRPSTFIMLKLAAHISSAAIRFSAADGVATESIFLQPNPQISNSLPPPPPPRNILALKWMSNPNHLLPYGFSLPFSFYSFFFPLFLPHSLPLKNLLLSLFLFLILSYLFFPLFKMSLSGNLINLCRRVLFPSPSPSPPPLPPSLSPTPLISAHTHGVINVKFGTIFGVCLSHLIVLFLANDFCSQINTIFY